MVGEPTWCPSPANPSLTPQNPKPSAGEPAELSKSCTHALRTPKGSSRCAWGRGSPSKLRRPHPTANQSNFGSPKRPRQAVDPSFSPNVVHQLRRASGRRPAGRGSRCRQAGHGFPVREIGLVIQ